MALTFNFFHGVFHKGRFFDYCVQIHVFFIFSTEVVFFSL